MAVNLTFKTSIVLSRDDVKMMSAIRNYHRRTTNGMIRVLVADEYERLVDLELIKPYEFDEVPD